MPQRLITRIFVHALPGRKGRGALHVGLATFPCALGRSGVRVMKREGDGGTPQAGLPLRRAFFRKDRRPRPRTALPVRAIRPDDAWCDDVADRRYNRLIRRPAGACEEALMRADHLYDVVIELGWNDRPVKRHRGSAIFWHGAREGFTPTAGCVAVALDVFDKVLPRLSKQARIVVR